MIGIIAFIFVFGLLVTVHEFGHLYFAKRAGIMCPEFAIGMGPKIFSYKKNETLYTIRMLPVGGYVMMAGSGMEQNPLTAGQTVSIKRNTAGEVTHVILDDQHQFRQIEQLEVEDSDFEDGLFIEGIDSYTNERVRYTLADEAYFVREGDLVQIAPRHRQFKNKKPWPKFLTLFAGPLFNFLLALVIFIGLAFVSGTPTDKPIIGEILKDSPADKAGLVMKDKVLEIDGQKIDKFEDMGPHLKDGETHEFLIERDGQKLTKSVTPKKMEYREKTKTLKKYAIGVNPMMTHDNFLAPFKYGFFKTIEMMSLIFMLVGQLFSSIFTGHFSFDMLNGPVGIYKNTEKVASLGILSLLSWAGMLSVNLGIMNLLPIPALDGGRILFVIYEAIFRKPVNKKAEVVIITAGAVFLFFVMIMVTWNDIQRYFFN
ncbi:RIP metalloprotease RseP [Macrococcus brunensis]|uniref:Zinc metalloprotease n=1 Tax=Macrococcus brunensis TaxID=198483 RepID=A0A4R6BDF0_9STAP|nr:RIP metalloprotease RseP [Macrococcus brunensis]TDL97759.1 RIP metalloprotease RseP [Macrococcus brunensis]ULG75158.1 RIP metalloprotease RseP [Macrococcus brunensis]